MRSQIAQVHQFEPYLPSGFGQSGCILFVRKIVINRVGMWDIELRRHDGAHRFQRLVDIILYRRYDVYVFHSWEQRYDNKLRIKN